MFTIQNNIMKPINFITVTNNNDIPDMIINIDVLDDYFNTIGAFVDIESIDVTEQSIDLTIVNVTDDIDENTMNKIKTQIELQEYVSFVSIIDYDVHSLTIVFDQEYKIELIGTDI